MFAPRLLPRLLSPRSTRLFSTTATAKPTRKPLLYTLAGLTTATAGLAAYQFTTSPASCLNPDTFTAYTLTAHTPITTTPTQTSLLKLSPPSAAATPPFSASHIQSIEIKNPQVQISRSYTPLPTRDGDVHLLIKREPGGEMSRYLFSLAPGTTIELRGPHDEYALPEEPGRLLFLAGGTGIAPALQCAHKVLEKEPTAEMRILWAVRNRGETDGAAAEELERLKRVFGGRLQVGVFCDGDGGVGVGVVRDGVVGWGAKRVVVSGPEGFVAYWAGEKGEWEGGREGQGALGGVLERIKGIGKVEVWKL